MMSDSRLHAQHGLSRTVLQDGEGSPSPVYRLSAHRLWLKDDGRYGSRYGGNKLRKLEWFLPPVLRGGARALFTVSARGATHGLATAAAAMAAGLVTHVAVVDQPRSPEVDRQFARLRRTATVYETRTVGRTVLAAPFLLAAAASQHRARPRVIPAGGSSVSGMLGYTEAGLELAEQIRTGQLPKPDRIVVPVGTGGTAAGLATGLHLAGLDTMVTGVVINDHPRCGERRMRRLLHDTGEFLRRQGVSVPDEMPSVELRYDWLGAGYGYSTVAGAQAVARADGDEGLLLDPTCSGKAFAAALDLSGDADVLFWNTFDARAEEFFPPDDGERR